MQKYFAALTLVAAIALVAARVLFMKKQGIKAMKFGAEDRKDFLIPPFAFFYFYVIFANAFDLPAVTTYELFHLQIASWAGVGFCLVGLSFLSRSVVSLGKSFRVGIDNRRPDKLVTHGAFAYSRNPIYVAFAFILIGQFLVFPNWILLLYVLAGMALFHRQVIREEEYLEQRYGEEYKQYRGEVRRYL